MSCFKLQKAVGTMCIPTSFDGFKALLKGSCVN